ncbi:MAG: PEP-CTERM sorting domain-containing protein [Myxococcota bacterium]
MRHPTLALLPALALLLAWPAPAAHISPANDTVDNGLLSTDPDFYSVSWDGGGSFSITFDGSVAQGILAPYIAYDAGAGLVVQSLNGFSTSSFSATSGPTYTPRGSGDSHSSVTETRSDGTVSVQATGSIADGSNVFHVDYRVENLSASPIDDVAIYLYLDGNLNNDFGSDLGGTFGATSPPFAGLILYVSDDGADPGGQSAIGLSSSGPTLSAYQIDDAFDLEAAIEAGIGLDFTVDAGPGDLAAAIQWSLGTLAGGGEAQVGGDVIANPVPEPGTLSLLALGLAACALRRGRAR